VAEEIGAHEIVVPDVLADKDETISRAMAFSRFAKPEYRYMGVVQGRDMQEILACLYFYLESPTCAYITSIGIPRLLNNFQKGLRVTFAEFVMDKMLDTSVEYHALGASGWIKEVVLLAETRIRGIDTSFPTYMGMLSEDIRTAKWQPRPDNYFEMAGLDPLIDLNIQTYLDWANYDYAADIPEKASPL